MQWKSGRALRKALVSALAVSALGVAPLATRAETAPTVDLAHPILAQCELARARLQTVYDLIESGSGQDYVPYAEGAHDNLSAALDLVAAATWPKGTYAVKRDVKDLLELADYKAVKLVHPWVLARPNSGLKLASVAGEKIEAAVAQLTPLAPPLPEPEPEPEPAPAPTPDPTPTDPTTDPTTDQQDAPAPAPADPITAPAPTAPSAAPVLAPGSGWSGATAQPATVGTGSGSDAQAIARWDVVPFQTFDKVFEVGVVAFHVNGIDRVEFAVDGGTWTSVRSMSLNPRTGVFEYTVKLDPADFQDGTVEVRAVAYPTVGIPRVLGGALVDATLDTGEHSMFLTANANGSRSGAVMWVAASGSDTTGDGSQSKPFATPSAAIGQVQTDAGGKTAVGGCDGAVIYLGAGTYSWGPAPYPYPDTQNQWITMQPAPGVARDQVVFTAAVSGGYRTKLIRAKDVTMKGDWNLITATGGDRYVWLDGVDMIGPGRSSSRSPYLAQHWQAVYLTDTSMRDYRNGAQGAKLARGCAVSNLGSDAYGDTRLLLNSSVDGIDPSGTLNHPDVYQFSGKGTSRENTIVYGLRAVNCHAQGIFADDLYGIYDAAFVNVVIAKPQAESYDSPPFSQWGIPGDHILLWNVTLPNSTLRWRNSSMKNLSVRACAFRKMCDLAGLSTSSFADNHFVDTSSWSATSMGTGISVGDAKWVDESKHDYRPATGSPLLSRLLKSLVPIDLSGSTRSTPDTVGAYK